MRKEIITKLLILSLLAFSGVEAYADTQADLMFRTTVPRATSIKKTNRSASPVTVNPLTGVITGELTAEFELDSNIIGENQVFVMTSSVQTQSGNVSGYDSEGNLLFTNISNLPTSADISEALSHSGNNCNVIVYPVTVVTTSPLTSEYQTDYETYGNCYVINVNGGESGTVSQNVASSPIASTFHNTRDTAGTYQAVITITAVTE